MANYKNTLNEIDRFFIDANPTLTVAQLVDKFYKSSSGGKIPSPEAITQYREKYKDTNTTTTTNAKSTMIKRGGAVVMSQTASERGDAISKVPAKNPPWVTRIYRDN